MTERERGHLLVVLLCGAVLATAVGLARVASVDQTMALAGVRIPETCVLRVTTGVPCAGCGLTRSWITLAQGKLAASLRWHRLGWLTMLYVLAQMSLRGVWLVAHASRPRLESWVRWLDRALLVLVAALLVNWVLVLAGV